MERKEDYFNDLKIIKKIMEESSRFLSLSGLSGISAGIIALVGGFYAFAVVLNNSMLLDESIFLKSSVNEISRMRINLIADAIVVLILALAISIYFSYKKSLRLGVKIWTPVSKRLLVSLSLPLLTGGIFILVLYAESQWQLIIPSMLIFYGLALINAGKFTYNELFYLGLIEIITGFGAALLPEFGLYFWCFGFGLLHIIYGMFMYRKYEG